MEESVKKKLALSKETLRALDEQELSLVVGGSGKGHGKGHGKTGQHGSCMASKHASCKA